MSRSNKSKIAVTLLGALAFSTNAQAQDLSKNKITKTDSFSIKNAKSPQATGAVISKKNSGKNEIVRTSSFSIFGKVVTGTLVALGAAEAANETVAGITLAKGKEPEKLIEGKYSIINGVRLMLKGKENSQTPIPDEKNDKNNMTDKKIDKNLESVLSQFKGMQQFEEFGVAWRNAYNKVNKNVYNLAGFYDDLGKAILNFITGTTKFDTCMKCLKASASGLAGAIQFSYDGKAVCGRVVVLRKSDSSGLVFVYNDTKVLDI